jgi:tetratricopeptide (TPR) repeat protein
LPFLHFNLGEAYMKKQEFDKAKAEFLEDAKIEPDVAFNYDQLGVIAFQQQQAKEAEQYFRHALRFDPKLASSEYQLARVYQQAGKSAKALSELTRYCNWCQIIPARTICVDRFFNGSDGSKMQKSKCGARPRFLTTHATSDSRS